MSKYGVRRRVAALPASISAATVAKAATRRRTPKGSVALRRQLALARFRAVREEVILLAEQGDLLTNEDVFRAIS